MIADASRPPLLERGPDVETPQRTDSFQHCLLLLLLLLLVIFSVRFSASDAMARCMSLLALCVFFVGRAAATYNLGSGYSISNAQRNELVADIQSTIFSLREPDEDGNQFYPFVAGFVRLAFHQCVSGKCIGCINLNDVNNLHLRRYVDALELVRQRRPYVRYGDLWALAGIVALQVGEQQANQKYGRSLSYTSGLQFRFGRDDCPTAPYTTDVYPFPSFNKGLDHVLSFFSQKFGMSDVEVVALLGVHTLGGFRQPTNERLIGQWASNPDVLDNSYYINMANAGQSWSQQPQFLSAYNTAAFFWRNGFGKRLMLNSDMCFYKDLTAANLISGGQATCTYGTCRAARTSHLVTLYATSNDAWFKAFVPAYTKMAERGYGLLALKTPVVVVSPPYQPFCILWIICF